jgi:hypothetical protein
MTSVGKTKSLNGENEKEMEIENKKAMVLLNDPVKT